jgi:hypothetical protein
MDRSEIELGYDIEEEEDEVILRELGGGSVGLLSVEFGGPGTIGFAARRVHDRARIWKGRMNQVRAPMLKAFRPQNHCDPKNRQAVSWTAC